MWYGSKTGTGDGEVPVIGVGQKLAISIEEPCVQHASYLGREVGD